jgi:electron transfer flavoprotein alpha subunit
VILGLVEHDGGVASEPSLQTLTLGRRVAERLGEPLAALVIGSDARPVVEGLAAYGVAAVHHTVDDRLDRYAPEAWGACLVDLMGRTGPSAVLAAGTDRGNEVMAHVGARTGLPVAANCTEVEPGEPGTPYLVTRLRWGGSLLEDARLHGEVKLLTVAPHAIRAEEGLAAGGWSVEESSPKLQDADFRVQVARQEGRPAGKISLPEARVVVGGGRGVGGPEGFGPLEELAELLGGVVGCSRVVTSLGWRPHTDQVGQTGVRIAPDVYIACGISGAIQHMVGAKGAKRILVVNTDPQAPILAHADYAIIGDVQQVVPALVSAIREAKGR